MGESETNEGAIHISSINSRIKQSFIDSHNSSQPQGNHQYHLFHLANIIFQSFTKTHFAETL